MEIRFNIDKNERKALVQKIAEFTGEEVKYLGVPSCAYQTGGFTVDKEGVLACADDTDPDTLEVVLDWLAEAGYTRADAEETDSDEVEPENNEESDTDEDEPEETEQTDSEDGDPENTDRDYVEIDMTIISDTDDLNQQDAPDSGFPVNASISVPITGHTVQTLLNLICMIHSRGALLSKATQGNFSADKALIDALGSTTFNSIHELIAYIREWNETNPPLTGITFDSETITFDGFGEAPDADYVQTYMKLAAAMNQMALMQKRVQAKDVDDTNEKYAFRIWAIRLGLNGAEYKEDRKRLTENLSGNSAFRNDEEKERWTARQKAKREAARAALDSEEANDDAVSE